MAIKLIHVFALTTAIVFSGNAVTQANNPSASAERAERSNDSAISEYSGSRTLRDLRAAMVSKGFTWLSGSPADNEKLSIGKNAQYFGFVALRYESDRAANRGALGRGFFSIANQQQRDILATVTAETDQTLSEWWNARETILRIYENHLYTGQPIDEVKILEAAEYFARLGATVAIQEARGFAALEQSMNDEQRAQIASWRNNPEIPRELISGVRVASESLERSQYKQLENLFAKAFSWLTGTPKDNEVIPLGQPAQFFGFVAIRHNSGHAANRGQISRSFSAILDDEQLAVINTAVETQLPVVQRFLEDRKLFLDQLARLRTDPSIFDEEQAIALAVAMGELEIEAGWIEAKAYRKIRESMIEQQLAAMMKLRGDYVLDESQIELLSGYERGAQLAILCAGCHGPLDQNRSNSIGPSLSNIFNQPIASTNGYEYSNALTQLSHQGPWAPDKLDAFLADPKTFAPGTKMDFQGLLNGEDRSALITYLQQSLAE